MDFPDSSSKSAHSLSDKSISLNTVDVIFPYNKSNEFLKFVLLMTAILSLNCLVVKRIISKSGLLELAYKWGRGKKQEFYAKTSILKEF